MNKKLLLGTLSVLLIVLLTACKNDQQALSAEDVFLNDYESHFGNNVQVYKGQGHSGYCFYQMDSTLEYSMGFIQSFEKISSKTYKTAKISVYVMLSEKDNAASLVAQVWAGGNTLKIVQKDFNGQEIEPNKWTKVELEFPLQGLYAPSHEFRAFVFNPNRKLLYLDDFQIEFLE
jgi:hypothetical protein